MQVANLIAFLFLSCLGEGESGGLGDDSAELVPLLLGDVLGDQGVLGLDVRELGHV